MTAMRNRSGRPALDAWWIAGAVFALSLVLWAAMRYDEARIARSRFERDVVTAVATLQTEFQRIEQVMLGAAGLFAMKRDVTADQWAAYVDNLRIPEIGHLGATCIGYLERVERDDLAAHEARMRAAHPGYRVWPEGARPVYFPLVLSRQPDDDSVAPPLGFDPVTNPERSDALIRALDTRRIAISNLVILKALDPRTGRQTQEAGEAVVMYAPVFQAGPARAQDVDRPGPHLGFILSAVRLRAMIAVLERGREDLAVALRPPGARQFVTSGGASMEAHRFRHQQPVTIGDAPWDIRIDAVRRPGGFALLSVEDLVLVAGAIAAAVVLAWARSAERARARVEADLAAARSATDLRFRELADTAPFIAWMSTPRLKVTYLNTRWWEFVGLPPATLPPEGVDMVSVHRDDLGNVTEASRDGRAFSRTVRLRRADGAYRWFLVSGEPLLAGDGTLTGFVGTAIDVHDQHDAQALLGTSQARYARSVQASGAGLWEWDFVTAEVFCSTAFVRMMEIDTQAAEGRPDGLGDGCYIGAERFEDFEARVHPDDRATRRDALRALMRDRVPLDIVIRVRDRAGNYRHYRSQADGVWNTDGRCVRCAGTLTDITSLKAAELEARRSHAFLDAIINAIPSPLVVKDEQLRWSMMNEAFARSFHTDPAHALGRTDAELLPPEVAVRTCEEDRRLLATGRATQTEVRSTIDPGDPRWYLKYKSVFEVPGDGRYVISVSTDIHARKLAEMEAERSRRFLDAVIEAIPIPVMVRDSELRCVIANEAAARTFALPADRMIGTAPEAMFTTEYTRAARAEDAALWARGGGVMATEANVARPDGTARWMHKTKVGAVLPDGSRYIIGVFVDLTERREMERALREHRDHLEELVVERTRELAAARDTAEAANRAKSEFLANMSHELRTPMHAILSFARLGAERIDTGRGDLPKLRQYLARIDLSGGRLLALLNDLLDLSKLEAGRMNYEFARHDLRDIVATVVEELSEMADEKRVRVEFEPPAQAVPAWCDPSRLGQVVRNVLGNALKFTPAGRSVRLTLASAPLPFPPEAPGARLEVTDEGAGIPDGELEAVFDKFVQSSKTRSGAGGTGLGLAICREIAQQHGGRIWAEHAPGGGARFVVAIPTERGAETEDGTEREVA